MNQGSGFMNLSRLLGVNRDAGQAMGTQMANDVDQRGQQVKASAMRYEGGGFPGADDLTSRADDVERRAGMLGTQQGRSAMLQNQYGAAGGYGRAQQGFDALLAGSSPKLQQVSGAYQNLAQQMGAQQAALQQQFTAKQKTQADALAKSSQEDWARRSGHQPDIQETQEQRETRWWKGIVKPGEYAAYSDYRHRQGEMANQEYEQGRKSGAY